MLDEARHGVDDVVGGEVAEVAVAAWWCFPSLQRLPLDPIELGFLWGASVHGELCVLCHRPHHSLFFMMLCDGAPPTSLVWIPPIRVRVEVGLSRWTEPMEIDTHVTIYINDCLEPK